MPRPKPAPGRFGAWLSAQLAERRMRPSEFERALRARSMVRTGEGFSKSLIPKWTHSAAPNPVMCYDIAGIFGVEYEEVLRAASHHHLIAILHQERAGPRLYRRDDVVKILRDHWPREVEVKTLIGETVVDLVYTDPERRGHRLRAYQAPDDALAPTLLEGDAAVVDVDQDWEIGDIVLIEHERDRELLLRRHAGEILVAADHDPIIVEAATIVGPVVQIVRRIATS